MAHSIKIEMPAETDGTKVKDLKQGQIARVIDPKGMWDGMIVGMAYEDVPVRLDDFGTFISNCHLRCEILPPGTKITIIVGD